MPPLVHRLIQGFWDQIKRKGNGRSFVPLFIIILTIIVLGFGFIQDKNFLLKFPWTFNLKFLAYAFIAYSAELSLLALLWHQLISHFSGTKIGRTNFYIYLVSAAARRIPTPIWYLGSRASLYSSSSVSLKTVMSGSIIEMALLLISGLFILAIFIPLYSFSKSWYWWFTSIIPIIAFMVFWKEPDMLVKIINWGLKKFKKVELTASMDRNLIIRWIFLYSLIWMLNGLAFLFSIKGLTAISIPSWDLFGLGTIYLLLAYISMFLTAGFGLKEIVVGAIISQWMPFTVGVILSFAYRIIMTIVELAGIGVAWLINRKGSKPPLQT